MREQFESLAAKSPHSKFSVTHVLSRPERDWKGRKGRIRKKLLSELIGDAKASWPLFCICGPKIFIDTGVE